MNLTYIRKLQTEIPLKNIFAILCLLISFQSMAEHDATYCGLLMTKGHPKEAPRNVMAVLKVSYLQLVGDVWEEKYEQRFQYAYIHHVDLGTTALQNLNYFLKQKESKAIVCVKARWGGALADGTLNTDYVHRVDYKSRFPQQ